MAKKYIIFARDFQTSVFPQYIIMYLWNQGYKGILGLTVKIGMVNREKNQDYIIPEEDWKSFQEFVQNKARLNESFVRDVIKKAEKYTDKLNEFTEKNVFKKNLGSLTNAKLAAIYQKFFEIDINCYAYGNLIFIFEFGEKAYFTSQIKEILMERSPKNVEENYRILVTPSFSNIFYKQSLNLLMVSAKIFKNKKLLKLFAGNNIALIKNKLEKIHPLILREFKRQQSKYHWLFFNWEGPVMEVEDFMLFAKDILNKGGVLKELSRKKNELKELKKKQEEIMTELEFNKRQRWYVAMAQLSLWFQPYRKAKQSKSCWHMEKYFKEVSKRLRLSLDQVRYLTHWEVIEGLTGQAIDINLINQRRKYFICLFLNNKFSILTGSRAEKFYQENVKSAVIKKNIKEIRGTSACPGLIKGKIRIVNNLNQAKDFKKGEILASYATNPLLLPYMRQSSAIITEEGGLTCHAAIVSRELNKPCVVGLKNLIGILKDGDRVEVDATKGVVKKLKI